MAKITIDARDALKAFTVNVEIRNLRRAKFQLWIALRLCRLACWIGNIGLKENQAIGVLVTDKGPAPAPLHGLMSRGDSSHEKEYEAPA